VNVAVVGAGAVGTTVAHDLAAADVSVTLFERSAVAGGSSGRAAGICYDAYADSRDAEIADRALERFRTITAEHDAVSFTDCPYVVLAQQGDDRRAEAIRERVDRMQAAGRAVELVDAEPLGERFPALRTDDVAIAAVAENAGYIDPGSYVEVLASEARAQGVEIREQTPVTLEVDPVRVVPEDGQAESFDELVVAAGAQTKQLLSAVGVSIPLKPYRVQALTAPWQHDQPICYDATAGWYCRPHPTGLLAGDGTIPRESDPEDWRRGGDPAFVRSMRSHLVDRLRLEPDELPVENAWAGLCTATPDREPLLGELRPNLFVATGWQGHGFMRAPAIGEALADQILSERDGIDGFDPSRFTGEEEFEVVEGMIVED
jgi:glycine/D-amino acid oxidase-like deaminating enzyme